MQLNSIFRRIENKERLNILTFPTHERYQQGLGLTDHTFFMYRGKHIKDWEIKYGKIPENHILLPNGQIPNDIGFDLVLSQNKFGQFPIAERISRHLNIPMISLEHTLPVPSWNKSTRQQLHDMQGDLNVFISDFSRNEWGFTDMDHTKIIHHMVDTDLFIPRYASREVVFLSVVNDWIGRDWCNPAGQQILTKDGYKNIEDITTDDYVLSDNGIYNKVITTMKRMYNGKMTKISFSNKLSVSFTPDHAIRVFRKNKNNQWKYIASQRIKSGDILRFPNHTQTDFTFNDAEYAWLIGIIIGDGHITSKGCIQIVFSKSEKEKANKVSAILRSITKNKVNTKIKDNTIQLQCTSKIFGNWLRNKIYQTDNSKHIPDFIINSSDNIRISCINGIFDADGTFKNGNRCARFCISTIYYKLASQISSIIHSIGCKCSINTEHRITNKSDGKTKIIYRVVGYGDSNVKLLESIFYDVNNKTLPYSYIVDKVEQIDYNDYVYNCEVDQNKSYVVYPGLVAHNCCGFNMWKRIVDAAKLPVKVLGDTPGLSKPASSIEELADTYAKCKFFINTSTVSPIPTALLEAMSSECICISTATCMIPEIIKDGYNGFISNDENVLASRCKDVMENPDKYAHIGHNARKTILEHFHKDTFVNNWNDAFRSVLCIK